MKIDSLLFKKHFRIFMSILLKTSVFLQLQPLVRHTSNFSIHVWCRVPVHPGIVSINSSLTGDDNTLIIFVAHLAFMRKEKLLRLRKSVKKLTLCCYCLETNF